jgi:hypothetical protein
VATVPAPSVLPPSNVPEPASELIGREEELGEILNLVAAHRLITLTGAGGIGKTTLALALARDLRRHFADGVWLAEFSALTDPALVPATVAAAVGLELGGGEASAERLAQALASPRLLVLDTCEHVIVAAAALAEAMLGVGSAGQIIATSREPLRAGGNGSIRCNRSPCRLRTSRLMTILCVTARFGCSSSGRGRQSRTSLPTGA